jgi:hypothetical protein
MQATGLQDAVLTLGSDRSFFMGRHKRHTPFAKEPKEIQFGHVDYNRKIQATIPRTADLLTKLYLVLDLGALVGAGTGVGSTYSFCDDVGRAMIESITLESGSVSYDILWPELMHAWNEISVPSDRNMGKLTGKSDVPATLESWCEQTQRMYIPLDFFFQNDLTQPMPLISMHLTDLIVSVKLKAKADIVSPSYLAAFPALTGDALLSNVHLMGEFIYLDDAERELFAKSSMSYIVVQNQKTTQTVPAAATKASIPIHFNHPTKEFIIMQRTTSATNAKNWFNFQGQETGQFAGEAFETLGITLNNNTRVSPRDPLYFRGIQMGDHHTRIPTKHVYGYSFAIDPENPASTGSLNLSRIENTRLELTFTKDSLVEATEFFVFARSINVIRVQRGVVSLKWSS